MPSAHFLGSPTQWPVKSPSYFENKNERIFGALTVKKICLSFPIMPNCYNASFMKLNGYETSGYPFFIAYTIFP